MYAYAGAVAVTEEMRTRKTTSLLGSWTFRRWRSSWVRDIPRGLRLRGGDADLLRARKQYAWQDSVVWSSPARWMSSDSRGSQLLFKPKLGYTWPNLFGGPTWRFPSSVMSSYFALIGVDSSVLLHVFPDSCVIVANSYYIMIL